MKLNAVEVTSSNIKKTVQFYSLLGFQFPSFKDTEQHIEAVPSNGSAKLMIDSKEVLKKILGEDPKPGNNSCFAVQYDKPDEIDEIAKKIKDAGFKVAKEPWNAFWGQRYSIVEDPDGYRIDLYATL